MRASELVDFMAKQEQSPLIAAMRRNEGLFALMAHQEDVAALFRRHADDVSTLQSVTVWRELIDQIGRDTRLASNQVLKENPDGLR